MMIDVCGGDAAENNDGYHNVMVPRTSQWELLWWAGDLLISDMMLAHSDRGHVTLRFSASRDRCGLNC